MSHPPQYAPQQPEGALPEGAVAGMAPGSWLRPYKPGETGNPGGYTRAQINQYREVRRLCADRSVLAATRLIGLVSSQDERVAYMACLAVMERGIGKPRDHSNEDERLSRIDLSSLSADERKLFVAMLRKVMGL